MKFEKPILNIRNFKAENVVTASGGETTSNIDAAKNEANTRAASGEKAVALVVTF